jgi:hypothetical protein
MTHFQPRPLVTKFTVLHHHSNASVGWQFCTAKLVHLREICSKQVGAVVG